MRDEIAVRLEGVDAVRARLALFPDRLRRNVLRGAIRAAAVAFRAGVRSRAPHKTGRLGRDIRIGTRALPDGRVMGTVSVGTGKGERKAFYAAALEGGARAHTIKPAARRALFFNGRFVSAVRHPGIKPRRFVEGAARAEYPRARDAFVEYVQARINPLIQG